MVHTFLIMIFGLGIPNILYQVICIPFFTKCTTHMANHWSTSSQFRYRQFFLRYTYNIWYFSIVAFWRYNYTNSFEIWMECFTSRYNSIGNSISLCILFSYAYLFVNLKLLQEIQVFILSSFISLLWVELFLWDSFHL